MNHLDAGLRKTLRFSDQGPQYLFSALETEREATQLEGIPNVP